MLRASPYLRLFHKQSPSLGRRGRREGPEEGFLSTHSRCPVMEAEVAGAVQLLGSSSSLHEAVFV